MVVYVDRSAAERAIACFVTAFAHCRPAVLTQTVPGTDTGDSYTFVVEPGTPAVAATWDCTARSIW